MQASQNQKLLAIREQLLHIHPLDRIPRERVNEHIQRALAYEQRRRRNITRRREVPGYLATQAGFEASSTAIVVVAK